MIKTYPHHPLADCVRMMTPQELQPIIEDMRQHGYHGDPIVLLDEQVLDGRNRQAAAVAAGIQPPFINFGGDDPFIFVLRRNSQRRHLNVVENAMFAAEVATLKHGSNQYAKEDSSTEPSTREPLSNREAAKLANTSEDSVKTAKRIIKNAVPEIVQMTKSGEISLSVADDVAKMPPEKQHEIARGGPEVVKREAVQSRRAPPRKRADPRTGRHKASESEVDANLGAIQDLLSKWESMLGFKSMVAQWEDRKRWTFCENLATLSRKLRKLADELRNHSA